MRETIVQYVNNLFCCAPDTVRNRELREEILQNALARYDDLLAGGETEPAACFILCPMPVIFLDRTTLSETLGPSLLLLLLAAGVGLLIYRANTCPRAHAQRRRASVSARLKFAVVATMWCLLIAFYFIVSFMSGAWYITWILFLIAAALTPLILALFDLKKEKTDE